MERKNKNISATHGWSNSIPFFSFCNCVEWTIHSLEYTLKFISGWYLDETTLSWICNFGYNNLYLHVFFFLSDFYLLIFSLPYAHEKYSIWRFKIDHLYKIRQFQLDRFLLKLFGKAILGIKRSISKEIWAKIEWMIIEFQSICELLTWFLLSVKCKRKRKKGKWIVIEILKAIYHYINSWSQLK